MLSWIKPALAAALALNAGAALAQQQQPASPLQTKAESDLNAAWQQMVGAAETAAISGPDQLRAAKAAQGALQAWMAEQRQKLADQQKDAQAKLEQAQRDRLSMSQQVAALNKQLTDAKKPNAEDQATIAGLKIRVAELSHACGMLQPTKLMPAHRAGPDAYVTSFTLRELLRLHPLHRLIEWSSEPALLVRVPFGKPPAEGGSRGMRWTEVDDSLLHWVACRDFSEDILHTVRIEMARREKAEAVSVGDDH